MLFNSIEFIFFFFPITALVYFLLARVSSVRTSVSWLVLASLFFYGWWNPVYLILIMGSMLFNYRVGTVLAGYGERSREARPILIFGILANLSLLGYFKYANFFVSNVNYVAGSNIPSLDIVLPLAISFFTFQQITFLVDSWQKDTGEHSFLNYALFVTFFPQLIAGPIVHHGEMLPQFAKPETFTPRMINVAVGMTIFAIGLFKKVVLADNLALEATPVFIAAEAGQKLDFFMAWHGVFAYTFQLYFDFSGYSDMAIGIARVFGVVLPLNFASPYRATNIIDFWRRWHMTLSRFLRDYVYIPLGGNRKGNMRRYINMLATMLIGGLWHGAGWTFVLWGGLHGIYLAVNHMWQKIWTCPINSWWSVAIARSVTLFFVIIAWVFFRAESVSGAMVIFDGMLNLPSTLQGRIGGLEDLLRWVGFQFNGGQIRVEQELSFIWLAIWLAICWYFPNTQELMSRFEPALNHRDAYGHSALQKLFPALTWEPTLRWGLVLSLMTAVSLASLNNVSEFLYFQF